MRGLVIGHGPAPESMPRVPGFRPYVPDRLALEDGGRIWLSGRGERDLTEITRSRLDAMVSASLIELMPGCAAPDAESWPCVEASGLSWIRLAHESAWRADRAQALLKEASAAKGDPLRAIALTRASAAMARVDLGQLVKEARSSALPGERLDEAYVRMRKKT